MKSQLPIVNCISYLFVLIVGVGFPAEQGWSMDQSVEGKKTSLVRYLHQLGDQYDCYFTIEESWTPSEVRNSLESYLVPSNSNKKGELTSALALLTKAVPHFTFQPDSIKGHIIHILDDRLLKQRQYGMDDVLSNVEFTGLLSDLVSVIARQGAHICLEAMFDIGDPSQVRRDWATVVSVKAENKTVRSLLSDFVPLEGYSRIIWIATTERQEHSTTAIRFNGPVARTKEQR